MHLLFKLTPRFLSDTLLSMKIRPVHLFSILFIIAVSLTVYANTLSNGFVYDDKTTVVENTLIKDPNNIPKLFNRWSYFHSSGENSYRPVVTLTYFIDYAIFDLNPWGFHLTNILLHTINSALLYIFLLQINRSFAAPSNPIFPLIGSILFAAHPVLTEAVNAISFREDLLAFLFYMATLNIYLLTRSKLYCGKKNSLMPVSYALYSLAILSKEMAITLPLIILCFEWLCKDGKYRSALNRDNTGFIIIAALYLVLRFYLFANPYIGHEDIVSWDISARLLTAPWLLASYIKLILIPVSLSADYPITPVNSFLSSAFILSVFSLIFIIVTAFMLRKARREITFGALFFITTLIPVYNLIPIFHQFAERYLYLPLAGFAVISMSLASLLSQRTKYAFILFFICTVFYSFGAVNRNREWADSYSLWRDTVKKKPYSIVAHNNLGCTYFDMEVYDAAVNEFRIALGLNPKEANFYYNIGNVYYKRGLFKEAIPEYEKALELRMEDPKFHLSLGKAYYNNDQYSEAEREFLFTLQYDRRNVNAHYRLGMLYLRKGQREQAKKEFDTALRLDPNHEATRQAVSSYIATSIPP